MRTMNNVNRIVPKELDVSLDYGVYGKIPKNDNVQINRQNSIIEFDSKSVAEAGIASTSDLHLQA